MVDIIDQASTTIEAQLEADLAKARTAGPFANLKPRGRCHWCLDSIPLNRTHCAPSEDSCAEDHLQHMRFHQNG